MTRAKGSVRIGPLSLLSLVIMLSLAVLAVLAVTTAQATLAAAEKQATFTADTYRNEQSAQQLLAEIDGALAPLRKEPASGSSTTATSPAVSSSSAMTAIEKELGGTKTTFDEDDVNVAVSLDGNRVNAVFQTSNGRMLEIVVTVNADADYEILQWKASTQLNDNGPAETLWSGTAQSR